jgi:hypothetical protein
MKSLHTIGISILELIAAEGIVLDASRNDDPGRRQNRHSSVSSVNGEGRVTSGDPDRRRNVKRSRFVTG